MFRSKFYNPNLDIIRDITRIYNVLIFGQIIFFSPILPLQSCKYLPGFSKFQKSFQNFQIIKIDPTLVILQGILGFSKLLKMVLILQLCEKLIGSSKINLQSYPCTHVSENWIYAKLFIMILILYSYKKIKGFTKFKDL